MICWKSRAGRSTGAYQTGSATIFGRGGWPQPGTKSGLPYLTSLTRRPANSGLGRLPMRKCMRKHTRKPLLLLRLSGAFLLRFATRQFSGLLFQEPPRKTRLLNFVRRNHRPRKVENSNFFSIASLRSSPSSKPKAKGKEPKNKVQISPCGNTPGNRSRSSGRPARSRCGAPRDSTQDC